MAGTYDVTVNRGILSPNPSVLKVLLSPPTSFTNGTVYYDVFLGIGVYVNGAWVYVSGNGGSSSTTTTQYMWIVGGASNFASLPGSPTPPSAGATTLVDGGLTGLNVRMCRNGLWQVGFNPGNGDSFYTKTKASNTVTFTALQTGDAIIIETIPS